MLDVLSNEKSEANNYYTAFKCIIIHILNI